MTDALIGTNCPIRVLLAAAGYGKTTAAVAALAEVDPNDVAWLSIDAYDSTELSFWAHLAAAIDRVRPGVLRTLSVSSERALGFDGSQMASSLVSILDADDELTIVFDDLHRLKSSVLWEQLTFFLERLPRGMRVLALSRSMPNLPVERWQIEGRATVIDEQTLRFNVIEAAGLVAGLGERIGTPEEVAELVSRSEGWAVGLLFEAISQQSQEPTESATARVATRPSRTVINYLATEVLNDLTVADREFLLSISVLDEFDNELCRQITGESDAGQRLRSLQVAHLFLVPVDERAGRFRFHHLFRDLLLSELESRDPGRLIELHRSAAEAAQVNCDFPAQIHHLIDAGDRIEAFDAMVQLHAAQAGSVASARELVARFPNEFILEDTRRMLEYSLIYGMAGDFGMADQWCDRAEVALDEDDMLRARLEFQRFMLYGGHGETQAALDALERSLQAAGRNPTDDPTMERLAASMAARIHILLRRDPQTAAFWLDEARHRSRDFDHLHYEAIPALSAFLQFFAGDLKAAERMARQSLSAGEQLATPPGLPALDALLVLADVLVETARLDEASTVLDRAEEIAAQLAPPAYFVHLALRRVELTGATQGPGPAAAQAASVETRFRGHHLGADLTDLLVAKHAYWLLVDGQTSEASRLSDTLPSGPSRSILRAKLANLGRREHEVDSLFAGSYDWSAPERLEAELVCDAANDYLDLPKILERTDGFTWTLVKQGPNLLRQLTSISQNGNHSNAAAAHVLEAAEAFNASFHTVIRVASRCQFTEREDALLRLLPSHLSYAEIAAELFISVNTVKSNLKMLYRKLGVSSRSEAVQRARVSSLS